MEQRPVSLLLRVATAWRRKLGLQLLTVLFVVSSLLTAAFSYYDYRIEEASARESLLSFGRSLARQAALASPDAVVTFKPDVCRLEAYVDDLVRTERFVAFAAVVRADGKLIASNPRSGIPPEDDDATIRIQQGIFADGEKELLGTFVLGISLRPMQQALREKTEKLLLRSSLGFLLVAALLWGALRTLVLQPLQRLDGAAQRLGAGELDDPIPSLGRSELGRLGRTMDEMRLNLQRTHRSLATQNQQLLESNRLKSQFLTNMSHEMRTPLTSILSGVEVFVDDSGSEDERCEAAVMMYGNSTRLLELVDRLLDLAKLEAGNLLMEERPCRVAGLVEQVGDRCRIGAVAKDVELRVDTTALTGRTITTDPTRLQQVVTTLIGNSVKFTDRGAIDVVARLEPAAKGLLLCIDVRDTGIGIPPEFQQHLFEPFRQADGSLTRKHGGTGLGLAIARRIARQLGGDITIASEPGRGTHAVLTIAVKEEIAPQEPADAAPEHCRVLVVDDAPDNQRLLKAVLTKAGHDVQLANNGLQALEAVERAGASEQFDLVVMDLQMPEMDGVTAIRRLRADGHRMPIVALTAHALVEDRERTLEAGADGYETKPISRLRVLEMVAKYARRPRAAGNPT